MPSAKPIKLYLEALKLYKEGDKQQATEKLAKSLGAEKPSGVIINSIDKLLAADTMPNDAVLKIISTEVAKGRDGEENARGN